MTVTDTNLIDKTFDPAAIRGSAGMPIGKRPALFRPERPDAEPFTIVNPPPNVTGSLHIGHALDNTLQDMLIRYAAAAAARMRCGWSAPITPASPRRWWSNASWPKRSRTSAPTMGREAFLEKVWDWKARKRRHHHPPAAPPGLLDGLGQRTVHHGRRLHHAP